MYYKGEFVWKNICLLDSYTMQIDVLHGDRCFLIGHHVKLPSTVDETSAKLLEGGFHYFNIFGENAHLWEEALLRKAGVGTPIQIEASTVDNQAMTYTLAMFASMQPQTINVVLSDDEYFTEYLVEDLQDIFSAKSRFSPYDWQRFRSGFEFKYHGKDAIISVYNGLMLGFLGEEETFNTIDKGFRAKLFDGKSFMEIWEEIR